MLTNTENRESYTFFVFCRVPARWNQGRSMLRPYIFYDLSILRRTVCKIPPFRKLKTAVSYTQIYAILNSEQDIKNEANCIA